MDAIEVTAEESDEPNNHDNNEAESQETELMKQQSTLRRLVLKIHQDNNLSQEEKAKQIQKLMMSAWQSKVQKDRSGEPSHGRSEAGEIASQEPQQKSYHDKETSRLGCQHYIRGCKILTKCCNKWFVCRLCHDEQSDHKMDRKATDTMMCMHCFSIQPVGQTCSNTACETSLSKYYCHECRLWEDDPRKSVYHCDECGICRIGKGLGIDYFHCKKCNVCMGINLQGNHRCIERNLESDCPICGEYMFTSRDLVTFMPCGHCMHHKCQTEYNQTSSYQCPTCFKSLRDMTDFFNRLDSVLAEHQMPPEYQKTISHIYCNDCEQKSDAKFHFLYHKCAHCGSYNTKVLHTKELS